MRKITIFAVTILSFSSYLVYAAQAETNINSANWICASNGTSNTAAATNGSTTNQSVNTSKADNVYHNTLQTAFTATMQNCGNCTKITCVMQK